MKLTSFFLGIIVCLAACSPSNTPSKSPAPSTQLPPNKLAFIPTEGGLKVTPHTLTPTHPTEISAIPTALTQTATQEPVNYYSPLQGIALSDLPFIISNPFLQPQIGKDDAHHGVDFAFYQYNDLGNIAALPIQSIFSGKISGVTEDLPPYGYMLIMETELPEKILGTLQKDPSFFPSSDRVISPQLTCPELPPPPENLLNQNFSLYVLYAHLAGPPLFQNGEDVHSGDLIGNVGTSGMSGNPHLHLEFRIGPSGYLFDPMGHYSSALTEEDFKNYCIWRVSGWFIPMDPMLFFNSLNSTAN